MPLGDATGGLVQGSIPVMSDLVLYCIHCCHGAMRWERWTQYSVFLLLLLVTGLKCGDVKPKTEKYLPDYNIYHNLTTIQSHLQDIGNRNPNFVKIDWIYKSRLNIPQPLVRVTNFTDSRVASPIHDFIVPKVKILFSYGEHAREFFPVESMFHLLTNLTHGLTFPRGHPAENFSRTILTRIDLFIIGMMNPDGRKHVETTGNYCWRGTSTGVDLNRNFDWQFGNKGSSGKKDDEEYRGSKPFSEPETLILKEITAKYKFDAFVSLHSGIRQIYVPYADTVSRRIQRTPNNLAAMLELADQMSHATSYKYTYGLAYQLNEYTADGTIFDFMAGVRQIPFSFAVELWGEGDHEGAMCFDLFNPTSQQLSTAVAEIHPLYERLFFYMIDWKLKQVIRLNDPTDEVPSLTLGYILLAAVVVLTILVAIHSKLPPCLRLYPRRRIISLRSLSSTFSVMGIMKL